MEQIDHVSVKNEKNIQAQMLLPGYIMVVKLDDILYFYQKMWSYTTLTTRMSSFSSRFVCK